MSLCGVSQSLRDLEIWNIRLNVFLDPVPRLVMADTGYVTGVRPSVIVSIIHKPIIWINTL